MFPSFFFLKHDVVRYMLLISFRINDILNVSLGKQIIRVINVLMLKNMVQTQEILK
jgi:hypothetical protein